MNILPFSVAALAVLGAFADDAYVSEMRKGKINMMKMQRSRAMETFYDVRSYGAKGDGTTKDTRAIQEAIDAAAKAGGGTVFFPAGTYLSGTVYLQDHTGLELSCGAVLLGSPDPADYNADDAWPQNWSSKREKVSGAHLVVALEKTDVFVRGGRIDGNRQAWMTEIDPGEGIAGMRGIRKFRRPRWRPAQMVYFVECDGVRVEDVELFNAPYWTCLTWGCENVTIDRVRVWNDFATPNGDGIDIDSCRNVTVSNCRIHSGDDGITLRADPDGLRRRDRKCELVTVTNCEISTPCNAVRIGVGEGVVRNAVFSNIVIHDTRTGICIINNYSDHGSGAEICFLSFDNIIMETVRPFYVAANVHGPMDLPTKGMHDISFSNITCTGEHSSFIEGNPDCGLTDISLDNVRIHCQGGADIAECLNKKGKFGEFGVTTSDSALYLENLGRIELNRVRVSWAEQLDGPWRTGLESVNVRNLIIHDCDFAPPVKK